MPRKANVQVSEDQGLQEVEIKPTGGSGALVDDFDYSVYFDERFTDERQTGTVDDSPENKGKEAYTQVVKRVFKPNYSSRLIRAKIRTAARYNVPIAHLEEVVRVLNNRKIDGIVINDLVGRTGFFDAQCTNRVDLAKRLDKTARSIEIADEKFANIAKNIDFLKAYQKETSEKLKENAKSAIEEIVMGH